MEEGGSGKSFNKILTFPPAILKYYSSGKLKSVGFGFNIVKLFMILQEEAIFYLEKQ